MRLESKPSEEDTTASGCDCKHRQTLRLRQCSASPRKRRGEILREGVAQGTEERRGELAIYTVVQRQSVASNGGVGVDH